MRLRSSEPETPGISECRRMYSALVRRARRNLWSFSSLEAAVEREIQVILQPSAFNLLIASLIGDGSTNTGRLSGRAGTRISSADRPNSRAAGVARGLKVKKNGESLSGFIALIHGLASESIETSKMRKGVFALMFSITFAVDVGCARPISELVVTIISEALMVARL